MDMPPVASNQADLGTFGFDLNFDDAAFGADLSFPQPPFDQDFDLYSYDPTLDFNSFLNYSQPFNLDGEYSQSNYDYSNISPVGYDSSVLPSSGVLSSSRPTVRSQAQVQVYDEVDSDERGSPSSHDSDQSRSSQSSYSDQLDVWDGAALHGGSSYLTNTGANERCPLHDHGIHGHSSSSSSDRNGTSTPPRESLQVLSEAAFADGDGLLLPPHRARSKLPRYRSQSDAAQGIFDGFSLLRSESARLLSESGTTDGIFEESSPGRSESSRRRSQPTAAQGIVEESSPVRSELAHRRSQSTATQGLFEESSQVFGTIARRMPPQDCINMPSGVPMEDSAELKTTVEKSRKKSGSHAIVERREDGIPHRVQELASDVRSQRLKDDEIQSRSQPTFAPLSGVPTTFISQLAVVGKALADGLDGLISRFSSLRVAIA